MRGFGVHALVSLLFPLDGNRTVVCTRAPTNQTYLTIVGSRRKRLLQRKLLYYTGCNSDVFPVMNTTAS